MAEDIVLGIKVEGAQSLSSLKKEFKDLQTQLEKTTEGTDEYYRVLSKLGKAKDDIGDLKSQINALNPEGKVQAFQNIAGKIAGGFQAATGAAALFGVKAEEVEATLLKVQAASALAEGITSIAGLSDAFVTLGTVIKTQVVTAFSTLSGAIAATGIGALVVALGVLIYKTQEYNESIEEEYGKQQKLNEELQKTNDLYLKQAAIRENARNAQKGGLNDLERELKLLEAKGAKDEEIAAKKQQIIDAEIFNLKVRRSTVEGDAKLETELSEQIKDKETERTAITLDLERRKREARKETHEEAKRQAIEYEQIEVDVLDTLAKKQEEEAAKRIKLEQEYEAETIRINRAIAADAEKVRQEDLRLEKEQIDAKRAAQESALAAISSISQAYFNIQLNSVKGNAAEELKIKKKQFEVDKALSIARATIDGIRSVQAALTIPPPAGQILAGANAILAAANIAKIASTKFDSGSTTISASVPSTGGSVAQPINPVAPVRQQDQTNLNAQGYVTKVIVVEKDITDTQNRVNRLKVQASY